MKVAVIGRTSMLYNTALKLMDAGHKITAIISAKPTIEYTKYDYSFKDLAKKAQAPFFLASKIDNPQIVKAIKGSDIAVTVNWVSIFTKKEIDYFNIGILNAHMGDLPRYRGNACPNWAILNGEKDVVLSLHLVEPEVIDCGRVIAQERLDISQNTYISDIYGWAEKILPNLFIKALSLLGKNADYKLKYADYNDAGSFRCYPRKPEDSKISWMSSAVDIDRLIRASSRPFSGAYGFLYNEKIIIWRSEVYDDNERYVAIPGQICEIGKDYFIIVTGRGKLKVTDWECSSKIKTIRQRLQ